MGYPKSYFNLWFNRSMALGLNSTENIARRLFPQPTDSKPIFNSTETVFRLMGLWFIENESFYNADWLYIAKLPTFKQFNLIPDIRDYIIYVLLIFITIKPIYLDFYFSGDYFIAGRKKAKRFSCEFAWHFFACRSEIVWKSLIMWNRHLSQALSVESRY